MKFSFSSYATGKEHYSYQKAHYFTFYFCPCIAKIQTGDPYAHWQACTGHIVEKSNFFICDKTIGRLLVAELSFSSERGLM